MTISDVKITKGQVNEALAKGHTSAKFKNKGVQKRLMKNQAVIKRQQELRENALRREQKILSGVMKNVAQSGAVLDQGVSAFSQLVDAKADGALKKLMETNPHIVEAARQAVAAEDQDDLINPASIGGDLIDVDHDPSNFGVQYASQDEVGVTEDNVPVLRRDGSNELVNPKALELFSGFATGKVLPNMLDNETGLIHVRRFTKEEMTVNRAMLNLYGDEQNYKPLPEIGDLIRADGIVIGLRDFGTDNIPAECDLTALTDINYVFDTLRFSPAGEVVAITDEDIAIKPTAEALEAMKGSKIRVTDELIMGVDVHAGNTVIPQVAVPVPVVSTNTQMTQEELDAAEARLAESKDNDEGADDISFSLKP